MAIAKCLWIFMLIGFHEVLKDQDVAWYASEEREEVAAMRKAGGMLWLLILWTVRPT